MSQYTLYVHSWDIGSGTRGGNLNDKHYVDLVRLPYLLIASSS